MNEKSIVKDGRVAVKERPILMSGAMVPPTLSGTKTQTRRIIKPQPHDDATGLKAGVFTPITLDLGGIQMPGEDVFGFYDDSGEYGIKCPYGQPGDRLWVRETFHILDRGTERGEAVRTIVYKATGCEIQPTRADHPIHAMQAPKAYPSIFMPRWASRILLEIVSVRIQRLQDISEEDAIAEGLIPNGTGFARGWQYEKHGCIYATGKRCYEALWEKINGAESWSQNPWVAAIEFKKLEAPHA